MSEQWKAAKAETVQPGDRVRIAGRAELTASRIEESFLGRDNMIAFIEDTPERWFKCPVPRDADVEVLAAG